MVQLEKERQNKLNWMNANGTNKGYTNKIYTNYDNLFGEREPLPEYNGMTKDELFGGYNEMAESLAEQRKALLSAALAQNRTEQEKANSNYDELARQAIHLKAAKRKRTAPAACGTWHQRGRQRDARTFRLRRTMKTTLQATSRQDSRH